MSKYEGHTPGPWHWWDSKDGRPKGYDLAELKAGRASILTLYGSDGDWALGPENGNIANARLIADAPKLLAQRDRLLEVLKRIEWSGRGRGDLEGMECCPNCGYARKHHGHWHRCDLAAAIKDCEESDAH